MIQGDGRTRDPPYKTKNKQNKKYQWSIAFQSLNMSEREIPLKKSYALHQIEAKRLTLSHKTCLSENLLLKMWELRSNQILQTVAYMAHCHNDLASFLLPNLAKLVNKSWSKIAGHAQHTETPNKVFHKKSANIKTRRMHPTLVKHSRQLILSKSGCCSMLKEVIGCFKTSTTQNTYICRESFMCFFCN